jgi:membrane protein involved in colicin uptake
LKNPNDRSFTDRKANSSAAKQALLERFKARPGPDDPIMQQRRAERQAIADARAVRDAEKAAARAEAERLAVIEAARLAEEERLAEIAREVARKAEQARRDAERPRKVLLEAVQYAQLRAAGKGRR